MAAIPNPANLIKGLNKASSKLAGNVAKKVTKSPERAMSTATLVTNLINSYTQKQSGGQVMTGPDSGEQWFQKAAAETDAAKAETAAAKERAKAAKAEQRHDQAASSFERKEGGNRATLTGMRLAYILSIIYDLVDLTLTVLSFFGIGIIGKFVELGSNVVFELILRSLMKEYYTGPCWWELVPYADTLPWYYWRAKRQLRKFKGIEDEEDSIEEEEKAQARRQRRQEFILRLKGLAGSRVGRIFIILFVLVIGGGFFYATTSEAAAADAGGFIGRTYQYFEEKEYRLTFTKIGAKFNEGMKFVYNRLDRQIRAAKGEGVAFSEAANIKDPHGVMIEELGTLDEYNSEREIVLSYIVQAKMPEKGICLEYEGRECNEDILFGCETVKAQQGTASLTSSTFTRLDNLGTQFVTCTFPTGTFDRKRSAQASLLVVQHDGTAVSWKDFHVMTEDKFIQYRLEGREKELKEVPAQRSEGPVIIAFDRFDPLYPVLFQQNQPVSFRITNQGDGVVDRFRNVIIETPAGVSVAYCDGTNILYSNPSSLGGMQYVLNMAPFQFLGSQDELRFNCLLDLQDPQVFNADFDFSIRQLRLLASYQYTASHSTSFRLYDPHDRIPVTLQDGHCDVLCSSEAGCRCTGSACKKTLPIEQGSTCIGEDEKQVNKECKLVETEEACNRITPRCTWDETVCVANTGFRP